MARRSFVWLSLAGALGLAGCTSCAVERRVEAQALDGGAPAQAPIPRPTPTAAGPALCFLEARERTTLLDAQAFALCQGAPSDAPVTCYEAARGALGFTEAQRVALCRCARSTEPVECVELLDRETFLTDAEIMQLCSPTIAGSLLASCRPAGFAY